MAHVPIDAPYATLSYCWGQTDRQSALRVHNISFYEVSIDNGVLPRTILDAMVVARDIGTDYLWVDSLCIIQDSREDWLKESACMFQIYNNSLCNIAATSSPNDDGGCFSQYSTENSPPTRFRVDDTAAKVVPYLTPNHDLDDNTLDLVEVRGRDLLVWQDTIENGPLQSRGWVLQERLMAPRIVHYAYGQIFWECHELRAWEKCPLGEKPSLSGPDSRFADPRLKTKEMQAIRNATATPQHFSPGSPEAIKFLYAWADLVYSYSHKKLTFAQDKPIAISSIARQFKSYAGCRYLAGLWDIDIWCQLGWYMHSRPGEGYPRRSREYLAPSWSWASLHGRINPNIDLEGYLERYPGPYPCFRVNEGRITPAGSNEFGIVVGGMLEVDGLLFPITAETPQTLRFPDPSNSGPSDEGDSSGSEQSQATPNTSSLGDLGEHPNAYDVFVDGCYTPFSCIANDVEDLDLGSPLYCMPIQTNPCTYGPRVHLDGLALKPSGQDNSFRRVGLVASRWRPYETWAKTNQDIRDIPILKRLGKFSVDNELVPDWNHFPLATLELQRFRIV